MNMSLSYNMLCLEGALFNLKNKPRKLAIYKKKLSFIYSVKILTFLDNRSETEHQSNKIDRPLIPGLVSYYTS